MPAFEDSELVWSVTDGQAQIQLQQLEREAEANRQLYDSFLRRLKATQEQQQTVGATAAGLYRATPQQRYPLLGLDIQDAAATSGALFGQSVADRADVLVFPEDAERARALASSFGAN